MGSGANLTQHAAVNNTGNKLATVHISIINFTQPATHNTQPATCGSRYHFDHDSDHNHANHSDLKQQ